jgi:ectoine hydroxylase-related dioxygenase (phytanoyl-CoA dioxygenase family)/ribosomal protein S18 acetylase RimI-like enzyme
MTKIDPSKLQYKLGTPDLVRDSLFSIEIESFPADEAASLEGMVMRVSSIKNFFLVCSDLTSGPDGPVVGFVNGTRTSSDELSHHAMDHHEPDGDVLVIQSVTVAPAYRRRGIATAMLKHYMRYVQQERQEVRAALLICKEHLIDFYASCGFAFFRESPVVHGKDTWYEMRCDLVPLRETEIRVDAFHARGFAVLENALDTGLIENLCTQTMRNFHECIGVIKDRGMDFGVGIKHGFKEVVQRHPKRFELTHRMDEVDCAFLEKEDSPIRQVVRAILGDDCIIVNRSTVVSLPNADAQAWHSDGPHMSSTEHLPCHVLNVFIPLLDMTRELGPTEFRPNSQIMTRDLPTLFLAAAVKKRLEPLEAPILTRGSALLFDYRVLHRGLANTSSMVRPILVYTFAKPWYRDVLNFPKYSIFDEKIQREEERVDGQ